MRKFGLLGLWIRSAAVGPLAFVIFFLICFALVSQVKKRRTGAGLGSWTGISLFSAFLIICCMPYLPYLLERPLIHWGQSLAAASAAASDSPSGQTTVIFVLGGGISHKSGLPSAVSLGRIARGLQLFEQHPDAWFCFSDGGLSREQTGGWLRDFLQKSGIPQDKVLLEERALSTQQNILYGKDLLAREGLSNSRVILITSASHLPRATLTANRYGLPVDPLPANEQPDLTFWPSWGSMQRLSAALHEYFGILGYKLLGWA